MASVQKFTQSAVVNVLRHNERSIQNPSNRDINSNNSHLNYSLHPDRNMTDYQYFKQRKSELYCYNRDDVKVMAGWVVTAPKDLRQEDYDRFFKSTYDFLEERYHKENVIQSTVHYDESGSPHLHFNFIPTVEDRKHEEYDEKICACEVLNKRELSSFHSDLDRHLKENEIRCSILTGITKENGRNYSVDELKAHRDIERLKEIEREKKYERAWNR